MERLLLPLKKLVETQYYLSISVNLFIIGYCPKQEVDILSKVSDFAVFNYPSTIRTFTNYNFWFKLNLRVNANSLSISII
jgi:hypothetical protein